MSYIGDQVNASATIAERAGGKLESGAGCAVKYDASGNVVLCSTAGEAALGVLVAQTPDEVAQGGVVTVQIKDVGLWRSGGAFAKGALLATDAQGRAVTAASGGFMLGMALESSGAAGQLVRVQLCKSGYKS